jgi:hypothetical protein
MNDQYLYSISKSIPPHISRTEKQHKLITTHDISFNLLSFPFAFAFAAGTLSNCTTRFL